MKEIKRWRSYWKEKGYKLEKAVLADDEESTFEATFPHTQVDRMYLLKYVRVESKRGRLLHEGCIQAVFLGSYHSSQWAKSWFKNA